jgi:hypothetical protein
MARIKVKDLPAKMEISKKEMRGMKGGAVLGGLASTKPNIALLGGLTLTKPASLTRGFAGISPTPGIDPRVVIGSAPGWSDCSCNAVAGIRG